MKSSQMRFRFVAAATVSAYLACFGQTASAAPTLLQTIDLSAWAGAPVMIVQPPPRQAD